MGESRTSCIGRGLLPLGLRAYPPHVLLKQLIISVFFKIKKRFLCHHLTEKVANLSLIFIWIYLQSNKLSTLAYQHLHGLIKINIEIKFIANNYNSHYISPTNINFHTYFRIYIYLYLVGIYFIVHHTSMNV